MFSELNSNLLVTPVPLFFTPINGFLSLSDGRITKSAPGAPFLVIPMQQVCGLRSYRLDQASL